MLLLRAVFYARVFALEKVGLFTKGEKRQNTMQSKVEQFLLIFFQLLFDTATLSILKLTTLKARGCKQRLEYDPVYRISYAYTIYSSIEHNTPHSSSTRITHTRIPTHEAREGRSAKREALLRHSCCIHRLKRSRTSPHSPGPQPITLITASVRDDAVDVNHRQELSTSSGWQLACTRTAVAVSLSSIVSN